MNFYILGTVFFLTISAILAEGKVINASCATPIPPGTQLGDVIDAELMPPGPRANQNYTGYSMVSGGTEDGNRSTQGIHVLRHNPQTGEALVVVAGLLDDADTNHTLVRTTIAFRGKFGMPAASCFYGQATERSDATEINTRGLTGYLYFCTDPTDRAELYAQLRGFYVEQAPYGRYPSFSSWDVRDVLRSKTAPNFVGVVNYHHGSYFSPANANLLTMPFFASPGTKEYIAPSAQLNLGRLTPQVAALMRKL